MKMIRICAQSVSWGNHQFQQWIASGTDWKARKRQLEGIMGDKAIVFMCTRVPIIRRCIGGYDGYRRRTNEDGLGSIETGNQEPLERSEIGLSPKRNPLDTQIVLSWVA
jgi:hypothetical protein